MYARQQMAQTIREPAYTALLVDSMDRYPDGFPDSTDNVTSSSQWKLNSNNYALNGYFTRIALTQVQFAWTLPTIITDYNDTLSFTNASGTFTVTIPQGFYGSPNLGTTITDLMNAAAGTTLITASSVGGAGNIILTTSDNTLTFTAPSTFNGSSLGKFYQTSGLLPNTTPTDDGSGNFYFYNSPPTMLATRFIDITSKYLTKFQRVKDTTTLLVNNSQNILARVYAFANGGSINYSWPPSSGYDGSGNPIWVKATPFVVSQDFNQPKQLSWNPEEAISNFDIALYDEYGQLVPWDPSTQVEYQFTLLCSET